MTCGTNSMRRAVLIAGLWAMAGAPPQVTALKSGPLTDLAINFDAI